MSMVIILPNSKNGLDETIRQMKKSVVHRLQWLMDETEVDVILPQFKFAHSSNLNDALKHVSKTFHFNASILVSHFYIVYTRWVSGKFSKITPIL